jgi:hypothetical protein
MKHSRNIIGEVLTKNVVTFWIDRKSLSDGTKGTTFSCFCCFLYVGIKIRN